LHDTVAKQPANCHRQRKRGEAQPGVVRFDAARRNQKDRAPIEHRTLGQKPDKAEDADKQHDAARQGEGRAVIAAAVGEQMRRGDNQCNDADGDHAQGCQQGRRSGP